MDRKVCLHGHFYQPDRADPWTGQVPREPEAAPYHDWNQRIAAECYRANAAARRLDAEGRIDRIVNNYQRMSWNAGPSLLSWLEVHEPWTYRAMIDADADGARRFSGHGPALAQPWVHAILPLAPDRDKATLVRWGVADFERRFARAPEGMWLPETAVDTATLEVLAATGITFTVLAPWQAARVRPPGRPWRDGAAALDPTRPYRCRLPSGATIVLFFYDGAASAGIAFQSWLDDGVALADRLRSLFPLTRGRREALVHVATDGESYGHHHRFGDMALAAALDALDEDQDVGLTVYGEHLASDPAMWEVSLAEATSWSCAHGVERWRADCGCQTGGPAGWHQGWRAPLRDALDWLGAELAAMFEQHGGDLLDDVWDTRDRYEQLLGLPAALPAPARGRHELDFVTAAGAPPGRVDEVVGLLEMQRHLLCAFESSAWFYSDAAGPETVLALRHAARALTWCRWTTGENLTDAFVDRLRPVVSNDPGEGDGSRIWENHVRPTADRHDALVGQGHRVAPVESPPGASDAVVQALVALADELASLDDAELDHHLEAAVAVWAADTVEAPSASGLARGRILLALESAVRGSDHPGRWWAQNAVVAVRDQMAAGSEAPVELHRELELLAAELGVSPG